MKRFHGIALLLLFGTIAATAQSTTLDPALVTRATAGNAAAQVAVGERLAAQSATEHSSRQINEDYRQAAEWYKKAADQGNSAGMIHLAELYRNGKGLPRDMEASVDLYRKAAELNNTSAQGALGVLYCFGQGVRQNYVEAYFWYELAASVPGPDQERFLANRQIAGTHITAEDLDAIEARIAQWKAAHPALSLQK